MGIENNLHRQLDVNFVKDASVIDTGCAAENLAIQAISIKNLKKGNQFKQMKYLITIKTKSS